MRRWIRNNVRVLLKDARLSLLVSVMTYFMALFGCLGVFEYFVFPISDDCKKIPLFIMAVSAVLIALCRNLRKSSISFYVGNTEVNVLFDNLFEQNGLLVIPVNNFIDSKLGTRVSENSLHGKFIKNIINGEDIFDKRVKDILEKEAKDLETIRSDGAEIGLTIPVIHGTNTYLLSVLTKTDKKNDMASATIVDLITMLASLLNKAREVANDSPLNIPLIGGGLSKIGLPPQQLLEIIVIMIVKISQEQRITSKINILITDDNFNRILLKPILEGVRDGV